jgi:hypothetical protein
MKHLILSVLVLLAAGAALLAAPSRVAARPVADPVVCVGTSYLHVGPQWLYGYQACVGDGM